MSMDKETINLWALAVEAYGENDSVTHFMQAEIKGLRDANGDPLPDAVKKFFSDLLFRELKPRKGSNFLPSAKAAIREQYDSLLLIKQANRLLYDNQLKADPTNRKRFPERYVFGALPPSEQIKEDLAKKCRTTTATIDQIVNPRKSRTRKKP